MTRPEPWRRFLAEFLGTAVLLTAVVGSGIKASRLSSGDVGLQLLENITAIVCGLAAVIYVVGPVSGAHLNPVVSIADWYLGRRTGRGLPAADLPWYVLAQLTGGIGGSIFANVMFGLPAVSIARTQRTGGHLWLGEVVATGGLILLIAALNRSGRTAVLPAAVSAYIFAACWFTSSASFANPAVATARALTDTFTGIAPASVPGFVLAELVGLVVGIALVSLLYPPVPREQAVRLVIEQPTHAGASVRSADDQMNGDRRTPMHHRNADRLRAR
jgi:arsenate reductase